MKYEIDEFHQEVINKLKDGWKIVYNTSEPKYPAVNLQKEGEKTEYLSGWTLSLLWGNDLLETDRKYPISTYKLK